MVFTAALVPGHAEIGHVATAFARRKATRFATAMGYVVPQQIFGHGKLASHESEVDPVLLQAIKLKVKQELQAELEAHF